MTDTPQHDIFISYSRANLADAERLYHDLTVRGFKVWWDKKALASRGKTFLNEIRDAITTCQRLILIVSPDAVASQWVEYEWRHALAHCKIVHPILLEGTFDIIPAEVGQMDAPDFRDKANYYTMLDKLISNLHKADDIGQVRGAPTLPGYYLERESAFTQARDYLIRDVKTTTVVTGKARVTGMQGMGGIGKSVLATAIAHDCEVRRVFSDGIYWVTLSQNPNLLALQSALSIALDAEAHYTEVHEYKAHLESVLAEKACLLILDDVWDSRHTEAFDVLGRDSRMLLTTRDSGLVQALGAQELPLDVLDEQQSLQLMVKAMLRSQATDDSDTAELDLESAVADLPAVAHDVAKHCGNLPLALSMIGAMVSDDIDWEDILEALDNADIEDISADFADYAFPNIFVAIDVSVTALADDMPRYLELACFPEDARIPQDTIIRLWKHTAGLSTLQAKKLLRTFEKKALLRRDEDNRLYLHDLQFDYLRKQAEKSGQTVAYHTQLLSAYNPDTRDWWTCDLDDYMWRGLAYHLIGAGHTDTLVALLTEYHWLYAKLSHTDPNAIISDCELCLDVIKNIAVGTRHALSLQPDTNRPIELIQSAIRLASHIIGDDVEQLSSQLVGRLVGHKGRYPAIDTLMQTIHDLPKPDLLFTAPTLPQAGGALQRTLVGHESFVSDVAISGEFAISTSEDKTVRVWNWQTGAHIRTLEGHIGSVNSVALTGEVAVTTSSDWTLRVWNWQAGEHLRTLEGHTAYVTSVALAGEVAVTASSDKTVRVWNWHTGEHIRTLEGHTDWVNSVALAGEFAVTASNDKTVRVWNWHTGEHIRTLEGHTDSVNSVALAGEFAVTASWDKTVRVWNWQTGAHIRTLEGHTKSVTSVALAGEFAVTASWDKTVRVWNWQTGAHIRTLEGHTHSVTSVALSGEFAVSASLDKTVRVWNWQTGEHIRTLAGHIGSVTSVALASEVAVTASSDKTVRVWKLPSLGSGEGEVDHIRTLEGHTSRVNSVTLAGEFAVSASSDQTVRVWNWQTGEHIRTLAGHTKSVTSVALAGEVAVTASYDKTVRVWNWQTGAHIRTLEGHTAAVTSVAVSGKFAVGASWDKTVRVWNWQTDELLETLPDEEESYLSIAQKYNGLSLYGRDNQHPVFNFLHSGNRVLMHRKTSDTVSARVTVSAKIQSFGANDDVLVLGDSAGKVHFLRIKTASG